MLGGTTSNTGPTPTFYCAPMTEWMNPTAGKGIKVDGTEIFRKKYRTIFHKK